MKPLKKILVIDDEPQINDLEYIERTLSADVNVESTQIEVYSEDHLDDDSNFVQDKLFNSINNELTNHYDLVMVDYDYGKSSNGLNGLGVIDLIRSKRKNIDIILYSADQKSVVRSVIGEDLTKTSEDEIVDGINRLMNYKIIKMSRRGPHRDDVIRIFRANVSPSPKALLCEMLRENGDKVFSSCCPKLKGKTFAEIANYLDEENNGNAHEWLKAMLEQVIAYLKEVNE